MEGLPDRRAPDGKLATTRDDGRPHVAPIWFDLDDATAPSSSPPGPSTLKGKAMRRDPRVWPVRRRRDAAVLVRAHRGQGRDQRGPRRAAGVGHPHRRPLHGRRRSPTPTGSRNAVPGELLVRLTADPRRGPGRDRRLIASGRCSSEPTPEARSPTSSPATAGS